LTKITTLRAGYREAETMDEKTRIENDLNREMGRLRVTLEQYPDLKASQNFLRLQDRISAIEASIADRREFFNDSVNIYNIQIQRFPETILAKRFDFRRHAFLDISEDFKLDVDVNKALSS
jgi:LemA protein